jgi:general secretion pathway protein G
MPERHDGRARRARRGERGLTLIEMMVVLLILGLLSGIVYQAVIPRFEEAKVKTARTQIEILALALDNYRLDVGSYPTGLEELVTSSAPGWRGPYLKKKAIPQDPWNNDYVYELIGEGNEFRISSTGGGKETISNE